MIDDDSVDELKRIGEAVNAISLIFKVADESLRNFFGDLVISSDDKGQIVSRLKAICDDELYYQKFRLLNSTRTLKIPM